MKKNILLVLIALVGFGFSASAQDNETKETTIKEVKTTVSVSVATSQTTEEFIVYGNCGMCERAIENTLNLSKGVSKADWDKKTDILTVSFDSSKIKLDEIKQKLADIGYDTDTHRAKESVYNQLPMCCQYDRPEKL